jgi:alkylresorcinol/alkylpyrone synthase
MRYINQIFAGEFGQQWDNRRLLAGFEEIIVGMPIEDSERQTLLDFVRFQLVGERSRHSTMEHWSQVKDFQSHAQAFEDGAEQALDSLAAPIATAAENAGVTFDALITTTATGNLMPGLGYRLSKRLGGIIPQDAMVVDLANVGCTGSMKALNLVNNLDESLKNVLIVAVEVPSTLVDIDSTALDLWQGNCTFGDGASAMWVTTDPEAGPTALAIEDTSYRQRAETGLNLISWGYRGYYTFALEDLTTFDRDVRTHVVESLEEKEAAWKDTARWAVHPAGIALLVRISRKLGIAQDAIQPSIQHYRDHSNMSSASIVQILAEVAGDAPVGEAVNLLTMGAGFNVIYGRIRKLR